MVFTWDVRTICSYREDERYSDPELRNTLLDESQGPTSSRVGPWLAERG